MNIKQNAKDYITVEGKVVKVINSMFYKVEIMDAQGNSRIMDAYISGKMRMNKIHVLIGDTVELKISRYSTNKAIISFRK